EAERLGWLFRGDYLVDFAEPGVRRYSVEHEEMLRYTPERFKPAHIQIEAGKRYYLRLVENESLLRIDPAIAEKEIATCSSITSPPR
ncbi:MAG: hypothetical protein AB1705_20000, partial [Verrucomicrobiota bacterium]